MATTKASTRAYRAICSQAGGQVSRPIARRGFAQSRARASSHNNSTSQGGDGQRRALAHYHWASALNGGGFVFAAGLLWYTYFAEHPTTDILDFGDSRSFGRTSLDTFKPNFREITPGPTDEVVRALKEVAESLAAWVPGGKEYVEKCFGRLQEIRATHEMEVNNIARDTYEELRVVANKKGTSSLDRVNETWYILSRRMEQLTSLAGDQAQQILDQHPELRKELNGSLDKLRRLGDHLGPGARKQVDETFRLMSGIVKQGVDAQTGERLRSLVQSKTRELAWRRERAWQTAEEQIGPLLERNPHVKAIFDQNAETLHEGRAKDVVEKVRSSVLSGHTGELERYIQSMKRKSQEAASRGLTNWLTRAPNGSKILEQLQEVKEVADGKAAGADQFARAVLDDVSDLLEQRTRQASRFRTSMSDSGERRRASWGI